MTGFASATSGPANVADATVASSGTVVVDMRSVNGRFLDLALRLPDELRSLEPSLRELVSGALRRGKVELRITTHRDAESALPQPQSELLNQLTRIESTIRGWLPHARELTVNEVLQWCRSGSVGERLSEPALEAA